MGTGVELITLLTLLTGYNPDTSALPKWNAVKDKLYSECTHVDNDPYALVYINELVNSEIEYESDGEYDIWQTPQVTQQLKTGDCEDYAILKLDLLARIFGICHADLAFVQLRNEKKPKYHAVVKVYGDKVIILDNRYDKPISEKKYKKLYKEIYVVGRLGWKRN